MFCHALRIGLSMCFQYKTLKLAIQNYKIPVIFPPLKQNKKEIIYNNSSHQDLKTIFKQMIKQESSYIY